MTRLPSLCLNVPYSLLRTYAKQCCFTIAFCVSLLVSLSAGAITSTFTADHPSGCAPLVVHFTPVDPACSGCTYSWNFGTGSPITGYTASSSFNTVGVHVVTLTVTSGASTSSSTLSITVNPTPTVNFTADDTAFCPGGSVTLTNASTNGTAGAATYKWSLGDGDTAITANTTHTYNVSGYYNVALAVTNSQGCVSTLTKTTFIHVYNLPVISFTPDRTSLCNPPGSVVFTNTTTGSAPLTYNWKFGDNGISSAVNPTHSYTTTGTFYVSLRATDVYGCADSFTSSSYIYVGYVNAAFSAPDTACVYGALTFSNTSSTHTFRQWSYGDGATASTFNGSHTYTAIGNYSVTLVAGYSPCSDTEMHVVHIIGGPPGSWYMSPEHPCAAPVAVKLISTAPAGAGVDWIIERYLEGLGPYFYSGDTANHVYKADSIVYITMIKTNPTWGCKDTVNAIDTLYDHNHRVLPDQDRGCPPFSTNLIWITSTSKPDDMIHPYPFGIDSITWHFGDGPATATSDSVTHTYTDSGSYWAKADVRTGNGCVIHDSALIRVGIAPAATFTASPLHVCKNDSVAFLANVTGGNVDSFYWDFGDFAQYTDTVYIKRHFNLPGLFTVTLTPCNNGCCGDTFVQHNYVLIDSPMAEAHFKFNCPIAKQVFLLDSSLGNDSTIWTFGDGDTAFTRYPVHTYAVEDTFNVHLYCISKTTGCIDSSSFALFVVDPHPDFTASKTALCKGEMVSFNVSDSPSTAKLYFRWLIDTTVSFLDDSLLHHHYFSSPGRYTIRLVTQDNNYCYDTVTKTDYVVFGKPIAGFSPSPPKGCVPLIVTFTDTSHNVAGLISTYFRWDFGDGNIEDSASWVIDHTYTVAGTYTVTEVMANSIGCKDTTTRVVIINTAHPSFITSTVHPCINGVVTFTNTSPGIIASSWIFGDMDTSLSPSPNHSYNDTGTYTVSLTVTDTNGCDGTAFRNIIVEKPRATFTVDDSVSVCIPFLAQFHYAGIGASAWSWSFGDTHTSLVPSPTNNYTVPGIYVTTLIATSQYGCKDTATKTIKVYGYPGSFAYSPLNGCSPLTVHFNALLTNVPNISWDFADGVVSSVSSTDTISHTYLTPGAYVPKLILGNGAGCVAYSAGIDTIKVSAVIAKMKIQPDTICPGTVFTLSDSSKTFFTPITTRSWTYDGITSTATTPTHSISTPGTYPIHLVVTNGWGCMGIKDTSLTVIGIDPITGDANVCEGMTTTLSSTSLGGTWSSGTTGIATINTVGIVTGIATGTAVITYSWSGCYITRIVSVHPTPLPIAGTMTVCATATTTLSSPTAGGTWSSGSAIVATIGSADGIVTGVSGGTAIITYSIAACYATDTVTVHALPPPISGIKEFCTGDSTILSSTMSGGTWSSGNTSVAIAGSVSGVMSSVNPGTAQITYTLPTGCYTTTDVTVYATPAVITCNDGICTGDSITLCDTVSGGKWSIDNIGAATIDSVTGKIIGVSQGTATVTYTKGICFVTTIATIYPLPYPGTITGAATLCLDATATLSNTVTGGTWVGSNVTLIPVNDSTITVKPLVNGTIIITYITAPDINGCINDTTFTLIVAPASFTIGSSVAPVKCYGNHDGSISLTVSGGAPPFRYQWSTGDSTDSIGNLAPGTYSVTVSQPATQCKLANSFAISQPDSITISAEIIADTCLLKKGVITTTVTGGTMPYTYTWAGAPTAINNAILPFLLKGTYTLTLTDAKGCIDTASFTVPEALCKDIVIPDVITPNGDGYNDTWVITGLSGYLNNTVQVFDKWGDLVYEKIGYLNEWYGQGKKGGLLPDGTYFYVVKLNEPNKTGGETEFAGSVMVKR